jgi:hypothetical protein
MLKRVRWRAASIGLCVLLACSTVPKPPAAPPPKPAGPPPAPQLPEAATRAQPPGDAWLKKPAPHGIALGVDDPESVARKLGIQLDLGTCRKNTAHWSRREAGRLKGNYTCELDHPGIDDAKRLALGFVKLGDDKVVIDAFEIAFDSAEWDARIAALEAEWGRADVSFTNPASQRTWIFGRLEIQLERTAGAPHATLRYVDRHAARRYLARAIKTRKVPRIVPQPKTIAPVEPFGLVFAQDDEAEARRKLEAAGFGSEDCRELAKQTTEGRVIDCALSGTPLPSLRSGRMQLVDVGDGRLRLALLEYNFDPERFARLYGEIEAQYGAVEQETVGTDNEAVWWVEPIQVSLLGNASMLLMSYRHGRLAQIGANLIARSNQASTSALTGGFTSE